MNQTTGITMSNHDYIPEGSETLVEYPEDFVPGDHDVVIGKGKKFYFHTGNQWLRTLVSSMLDEYKQAQTKSDKSNIISYVVQYVHQHGRFVKRDLKTGRWIAAEPLLCREKCSQTFRDNLAETYRSSNVAKRNKRREEQMDKKQVDVKRMRIQDSTLGINKAPFNTHLDVQQFQQHQQQQEHAPAQPIPSNLFALDLLPMLNTFDSTARPSGRNDNASGYDFSNLNNLVSPPAANNASAFQFSGLNSASLDILLSNLGQLAAANNNCNGTQTYQVNHQYNHLHHFNPFEPTPITTNNTIHQVTGVVDTLGAASMPSIESGNFNHFEPVPMQEKRHSLAFGDIDWLKVPTDNTNNGEETPMPSMPFAFAA